MPGYKAKYAIWWSSDPLSTSLAAKPVCQRCPRPLSLVHRRRRSQHPRVRSLGQALQDASRSWYSCTDSGHVLEVLPKEWRYRHDHIPSHIQNRGLRGHQVWPGCAVWHALQGVPRTYRRHLECDQACGRCGGQQGGEIPAQVSRWCFTCSYHIVTPTHLLPIQTPQRTVGLALSICCYQFF